MELNRKIAEMELKRAGELNPGKWTDHSRFVAFACKNIAAQCSDLSAEKLIASACYTTSDVMPE